MVLTEKKAFKKDVLRLDWVLMFLNVCDAFALLAPS